MQLVPVYYVQCFSASSSQVHIPDHHAPNPPHPFGWCSLVVWALVAPCYCYFLCPYYECTDCLVIEMPPLQLLDHQNKQLLFWDLKLVFVQATPVE